MVFVMGKISQSYVAMSIDNDVRRISFLYGAMHYHLAMTIQDRAQWEILVGAWLRDVAVAGTFLTSLPFRPTPPVDMADLGSAARVFPLIGLVVGVTGGGALWLAGQVGLQPMVCAIIGLAATAWVTGALHEDGLADFVDGIGARDQTRRLAIMRDSRIGTFGVLALIFSMGLKVALLAGLLGPGLMAVALIGAAAASRGVMPVLMFGLTPARADGLGRDAGRPTTLEMGTAAAFSISILFILFDWRPTLLALALVLISTAVLGWLAQRRLGGYTGDVLGAAQQVAEVCILIAAGAYAI